MTAKSNFFLPSALLALNAIVAAANWYLHPERARAWVAVVLLLGGMTLALFLIRRRAPGQSDETGDSIRQGIVFAAVIMLVSLAGKLAIALGGPSVADLAWRATMAIVGAFLAVTGNAIPKTLTPLASLECDASRVQAFQRSVGWTWVLTGLVLAIAWLMLPIAVAGPVTFLLLPTAILISVVQLVRLRAARQRTA